MISITAMLLAMAGLGAGLVHLATAGGAPLVPAILLVVGSAEIAWSVTVLARGRVVLPRTTLALAVVPVLGAALGFLPMAVASLFDLVIAATLAARTRAARPSAVSRPDQTAQPSPKAQSIPEPALPRLRATRFLVAVVLGASVVAGLTTPALAASDAGAHAVPHGTHH